MPRTSKGRIYTRKTKKHGNVYCLQWYVNGKENRATLYEDTPKGRKPITNQRKAQKEANRILAPLFANDEVQRRQQALAALDSALESAENAVELVREHLDLDKSWQAYLDSPDRPDSSQATLKQYSFQWDRFITWAVGKKIDKVIDVTPEYARQYARELNQSNLSANTVNKHLRLLRLVFETLGETEINPFKSIRPRVEEQESRREFSWDMLCKICDNATGELKTLLFLGIYTGQRLKDCALLEWVNVDLMRGWILMKPAKTRRRNNSKTLHIPILPDLRAVLEETPESKRKGYVLSKLAAQYNESRDKVTDKIQTLFKESGVQLYKPGTGKYQDENGKLVSTGKRAVLQYGFHSLRHTTVSLLQQAGVPQSVVQEIVGHRTVAMTQRYTHVGHEAIESAMKQLPSITNGAVDASQGEGREALPSSDKRLDRIWAKIKELPPDKLSEIEEHLGKL